MRLLVTSFSLTLAAGVLAVSVSAAATAVSVSGTLNAGDNAGANVSASCRVTNRGLTGSGSISGRNPQTRASYSYPFNITGSRTSNGYLTLTGNFTTALNRAPVTLSCQSPNGRLTFSYPLTNGRTASGSGTGQITTR